MPFIHVAEASALGIEGDAQKMWSERVSYVGHAPFSFRLLRYSHLYPCGWELPAYQCDLAYLDNFLYLFQTICLRSRIAEQTKWGYRNLKMRNALKELKKAAI